MFIICRKTDGPMSIMARGDCEDFVKHYVKYNIGDRDLENYEVLKTETLDIAQFVTPKIEPPLEPTGQ